MSPSQYAMGRIALVIPILVVVSVLTFALSNLTPGDPALTILQAQGHEPTPAAVAALHERLGLDLPLHRRYLHWLGRLAHGDLGVSFVSGQPVLDELRQRFPATLRLALAALLLAALLTLLAGLVSARYRHSSLDHLIRIVTVCLAALPGFWLGLLLLQYFGARLRWFPVVGDGDLHHLVLPAVTLALNLSAVYIRLLRASALEVLAQDFVLTLRAKGLSERSILLRHVLRRAALPVCTAFGLNLGGLLGGSVIIETVFAWPGMGAYAVAAVFHRDYPVLQGYALLMTLVFVCTNLLTDMSYRGLDPRVRLGGATDSS